MQILSPKKLLHSKWTAAQPENKEKHFSIIEVEYNDDGEVVHCVIEAIMSKRAFAIDWRGLRDSSQWLSGWR